MKFGALSPTSRLANTEEEVININTKRNIGLITDSRMQKIIPYLKKQQS